MRVRLISQQSITFRTPSDTLDEIKDAAAWRKESMSEFVRASIDARLRETKALRERGVYTYAARVDQAEDEEDEQLPGQLDIWDSDTPPWEDGEDEIEEE